MFVCLHAFVFRCLGACVFVFIPPVGSFKLICHSKVNLESRKPIREAVIYVLAELVR